MAMTNRQTDRQTDMETAILIATETSLTDRQIGHVLNLVSGLVILKIHSRTNSY